MSEHHQHIFDSGVRVNPRRSPSTTSSEMPPMPGPPVRAATVMKPARMPEVMKVLLPRTT
ncbi:MAG: hypothetical protein U0168_31060 [Nannocystaceae bacterium]